MTGITFLNHGIQGQTILPKQVPSSINQGLMSSPQNQKKFRDLGSPSHLKGSPDSGAPQRGQANLDASAKSMVTVQSDPDGSKFLRTGIYKHNQTTKVSKESVTHNTKNLVGVVNADGDKDKPAMMDQAQRGMLVSKDGEKNENAFAKMNQIQKGAPAPQAHILMIKQGGNVGPLDEESKTLIQIPPKGMP